MEDPELHREANDRYFGAPTPATPEPEDDQPGRFAVRIVYPDGLEREDSAWATHGRAETVAARARENLAIAGSPARVEVVDLTEEERCS